MDIRKIVVIFGFLMAFFLVIIVMTACTISFQNISTKGTATDVVDENQDASPTVSPDVSIPALGL